MSVLFVFTAGFISPASGSNSLRNLPTLYLVYISEGEKLHPVERLCPAGALMDSSSVGNLPVVSPQRFLIGAVRYGLLTLALTSSYTINAKKSSVLENFVLTGSVRAKIEFTESVSARSIYLFLVTSDW